MTENLNASYESRNAIVKAIIKKWSCRTGKKQKGNSLKTPYQSVMLLQAR